MTQTPSLHIESSYLWFITLSYCMVIILANWFDPRLVRIMGLTTDAGTLVFPLTFLLSDLITEVYGYKYARRAIWCGFLFNGFYLAYSQLVIHLPSPSFATNNAMFDEVLAINSRIILASAFSYLCAEPLNSLVLSKLKISMHGRNMPIRFVASTVLAACVDSLIFTVIAFYGTMPDADLVLLMVTMWFIKVVIELLGLPISIYLALKLKRIEQIDMYDTHTAYNIFSLNTDYQRRDNFY